MRLLIAIYSLLLIGCQADRTNHKEHSGYLLILNKSSHSAWLLNAKTGNKLAEFATGVAPHEVAISPDKSSAIITNYGDQHPGNSLTIINLDNNEIRKTLSLGPYTRPHGVEWFSDNKRAIVSVEGQQAVVTVDVNSGEILNAIKTNQDVSHMVALGPDEIKAYATNLGSGSVSILDLENEQVSSTIQTGDGAEGVVVIPKTNEVWVTNRSANTISILDLASNSIADTLASSDFPIRAEASNNQKWVAVSNAQSSEIAIFDTKSREQLQKISTVKDGEDGVPIGLTFSDDDRYLYVANSEQNNIAVFDTESWQRVNTFETDETPDGIAYISKTE